MSYFNKNKMDASGVKRLMFHFDFEWKIFPIFCFLRFLDFFVFSLDSFFFVLGSLVFVNGYGSTKRNSSTSRHLNYRESLKGALKAHIHISLYERNTLQEQDAAIHFLSVIP